MTEGFVSVEGLCEAGQVGEVATGRDLPMSKGGAVEMLGGLLDHCRCWWMREDGTMAGSWAIGTQQLQDAATSVSMDR